MNHEEAFPPDSVDEQVEQFTSASLHTSLPPGMEVIPRLSALYKADQQSTERVWERLVQHLAEHNANMQLASSTPEAITVPERYKEREQLIPPPSRLSRHTGSSRLAQVATILFAVLLVGSLLWVLHLAQSTRTTQTPTPTTTPAGSPHGIYISRSNDVYRLDIRTRKVIWHTHIASKTRYALIAVLIGKTVYIIPNTGGPLTALNAQTGALRWSHTFKENVLLPYMDDGLLYVRDFFGKSTLYAVNPANGALIATYTPKQGYWNSPIVVHGILYYGAGSSLYAVQLPGEKLLWQQQLSNQLLFDGLSVQYGIVYASFVQCACGGHDQAGLIDAFDAQTGHKLWQSPALPRGVRTIAVTDEMIYAAAFDELVAFDRHSHTIVWSQPLNTFDLVVVSGTLYITFDKGNDPNEGFAALDARTGKLLWQKINRAGGGVELAGVLGGIFYGAGVSNDGKEVTLYALNASNGSQLWTMPGEVPYLQWGGMTVG